ncbi:MAG: hypothetical protein MHMPM18_001423 [Marteilia pararefringens]
MVKDDPFDFKEESSDDDFSTEMKSKSGKDSSLDFRKIIIGLSTISSKSIKFIENYLQKLCHIFAKQTDASIKSMINKPQISSIFLKSFISLPQSEYILAYKIYLLNIFSHTPNDSTKYLILKNFERILELNLSQNFKLDESPAIYKVLIGLSASSKSSICKINADMLCRRKLIFTIIFQIILQQTNLTTYIEESSIIPPVCISNFCRLSLLDSFNNCFCSTPNCNFINLTLQMMLELTEKALIDLNSAISNKIINNENLNRFVLLTNKWVSSALNAKNASIANPDNVNQIQILTNSLKILINLSSHSSIMNSCSESLGEIIDTLFECFHFADRFLIFGSKASLEKDVLTLIFNLLVHNCVCHDQIMMPQISVRHSIPNGLTFLVNLFKTYSNEFRRQTEKILELRSKAETQSNLTNKMSIENSLELIMKLNNDFLCSLCTLSAILILLIMRKTHLLVKIKMDMTEEERSHLKRNMLNSSCLLNGIYDKMM